MDRISQSFTFIHSSLSNPKAGSEINTSIHHYHMYMISLFSYSVTELLETDLTVVINLVSSKLLAHVTSIQWIQGPTTFTVTPDFIHAASNLKTLDILRLPQVHTLDASELTLPELTSFLQFLNSGLFSSISSLVLSKSRLSSLPDMKPPAFLSQTTFF